MNLDLHLQKSRNNIFIIDKNNNLNFTYEEFLSFANSLDLYFSLPSNIDKIILYKNNSLELALFYFWALIKGIKVFPVSPKYSKKFVLDLKKEVNADIVIDDNFVLKKDEVKRIKNNILINNNYLFTINKILQNISKPIFFFLSSGTTGKPKCIIHRFIDFIENSKLFISYHKFSKDDRFITLLDMTYMAGFYNMFLLPFFIGASTVIKKSFNVGDVFNFWKLIIKDNVSVVWLVPTIIKLLLEFDRNNIDLSSNIKYIFSCTAPLNLEEKTEFRKKYKKKIFNTYGLSEVLFVSSENENYYLEKEFYVGKPLLDVYINKEKILVVKNSKNYFYGYLINNKVYPSKEEFLTKDLAILNDKGLFILGRADDIIIKSGLNIQPLIIENIIKSLEFVKDCAVVGIKDNICGNRIILFLVLNEKININKSNMEKLINEKLKKEFYNTNLIDDIITLKNIPKNINMKVDRKKLVDTYYQIKKSS